MAEYGNRNREYIIANVIMLAAVLVNTFLDTPFLYIITVSACMIYIAARFSAIGIVCSALVCYAAEAALTWALGVNLSLLLLAASVAMGIALRNKKSMLIILASGVTGYAVSIGALSLVRYLISGGAYSLLSAEEYAALSGVFAQVSEIYGAALSQQMMLMMVRLSPAVAVYLMAALSYFAFLTARAVLRRVDEEGYHYFKPFDAVRADKLSAVVFLVLFMSNMFVSDGILSIVFLNMFMILGGMMWLCGLSVVIYYIRRFKSPLGRIFGLVILFFAAPFLVYVLIFLGAADAFFNIRGRRKDNR